MGISGFRVVGAGPGLSTGWPVIASSVPLASSLSGGDDGAAAVKELTNGLGGHGGYVGVAHNASLPGQELSFSTPICTAAQHRSAGAG